MNARQLVAMSVVLGLINPTGLLAQVRTVRCESGWFGRLRHRAVRRGLYRETAGQHRQHHLFSPTVMTRGRPIATLTK
jgi:hypothetical protein